MKAQRRFGLSLSWPRLTAVFLVDVVIMVVASHCPESWQGTYRIAFWVGVGLAALVTLLSLVTYHGLTRDVGVGHVAVGLVRRPGLRAGRRLHARPLDYQRKYGRDTVGVRRVRGPAGHGDRASAAVTTSIGLAPSSPALGPHVAGGSGRCWAAPVRHPPRRHRHRVGEGPPRWPESPPSCPSSTTGAPKSGRWPTTARLVRSPHLAGVADEPAAQRRRRRGPRFAGVDVGGGHRAARPGSRRTKLRGPALDRGRARRGRRRGAGRSGTDLEPPRLAPPQALQRVRHQPVVVAVRHHHRDSWTSCGRTKPSPPC